MTGNRSIPETFISGEIFYILFSDTPSDHFFKIAEIKMCMELTLECDDNDIFISRGHTSDLSPLTDTLYADLGETLESAPASAFRNIFG